MSSRFFAFTRQDWLKVNRMQQQTLAPTKLKTLRHSFDGFNDRKAAHTPDTNGTDAGRNHK